MEQDNVVFMDLLLKLNPLDLDMIREDWCQCLMMAVEILDHNSFLHLQIVLGLMDYIVFLEESLKI